jgi:hypothetical protein
MIATVSALAIVVVSIGALSGGTLGLPSGDRNEDLSFASTLADDGQARRILYASPDRTLVPGESRKGPGFWYRVLDGTGTTIDEVWLPPERSGDRKLSAVIDRIATGSVLRPGASLSEFGIGWIVVDGPESSLDRALMSQFDVVPLPFDTVVRVYENPTAVAIASTGDENVWVRDGLGWSGETGTGQVTLAINYTSGWEPGGEQVDWYTTVASATGASTYPGHVVNTWLGYGSIAVLVGGLVLMGVGRRRA